jgi:O-antigen ligase
MLKSNNININFLLYLFPVVLLLRSATLNLYIIFLGLIFVYYFFKKIQFYDKKFKNIVYSFFVFYFYIILISFFSVDQVAAFKASISQIRFFFFFLFFFVIIKIEKSFFNKLIFFFKFILIIFSLDLVYQALNHDYKNIIGIASGGNDPRRFSGFFGDELVAGTYIFFLAVPIISDILFKFSSNDFITKFVNVFFVIIVSSAITLTGDRLATIFYFLLITLVAFFIFNYKKIISFVLVLFTFLFFIFTFNTGIQERYKETIGEIKNYKQFGYFRLFSSSFNIWQNNKVFGVGLKNYRVTCNINTKDQFTDQSTLCSSHPHQNWLELLVETGIVGTILFLVFIINIAKYVYSRKSIFNKKNNIYAGYAIGLLMTLVFFLWPIKSSGSMFTTFFMSFVWFNLALLFSLLKHKNAS